MALALKICSRMVARGKYPYVVLGAAIVAILCASIGHSFMVAPYNDHICDDINVSHTYIASIWAIALLSAAGWVNVVGRIADRSGARPLIFFGGLAEAFALACFGSAKSPLMIGLGYCLLRMSSVETVDFACRHCINQRFVERRGLAAGMLNTLGAAMMLLPAGETLLIGTVGWRNTAIFVGVLVGLLLVICSALMLSQPAEHGLEPDARSRLGSPSVAVEESVSNAAVTSTSSAGQIMTTAESAHAVDANYTYREAVRTMIFWSLSTTYFVALIPWGGINFLLVAILKEGGHSHSEAAYVYVALSVMSASSSAVCGCAMDKASDCVKQKSMVATSVAMLLVLLAAASLELLPGPLGPLVLGFFLGCWQGSSSVVSTTIIANLFGRQYQGAIRSLFVTLTMMPSAIGPVIIASIRRVSGRYSSVFWILACCQVFAIALVCISPLPSRGISPMPLVGAERSIISMQRQQ